MLSEIVVIKINFLFTSQTVAVVGIVFFCQNIGETSLEPLESSMRLPTSNKQLRFVLLSVLRMRKLLLHVEIVYDFMSSLRLLRLKSGIVSIGEESDLATWKCPICAGCRFGPYE